MSWPFQPLLPAAADLLATVPSGVQVDAVTTGSSDGNPSVSHTCTGTDRALYLIINHRFDWTPTATYNGVSMTQIGRQTNSNTVTVTAFRLIAPATGSNTLAISGNSGSDDLLYAIISLTGVDQTTPEGTIVSGTGTGTSPSLSVTSETDGLVIDALAVLMTAAQTITVGAGQTERHNATNAPDLRGGVSTEPGATSVTSSWTISASATYTNLAIPVSPVAAGSIVTFDLSVAGTSSVAVANSVTRGLAATIAGQGAVADQLSVTRDLATTIAGTSAVTIDLSLVKLLELAVAGQGAVAMEPLAVTRGLQLDVAGIGSLALSNGVIRALAASIAGVGAVTMDEAVTRALALVIAGTSAVAQDLTTSSNVTLAMNVEGQGAVAVGPLAETITLALAVAGAAQVAIDMQVDRPVVPADDEDPNQHIHHLIRGS